MRWRFSTLPSARVRSSSLAALKLRPRDPPIMPPCGPKRKGKAAATTGLPRRSGPRRSGFMYAMFVMVGTGGLMVTAQLAPLARDFAIDTAPVSILGLTMPALGFALAVGLVCNGLSRPFFGLPLLLRRSREHHAHRVPLGRHRHLLAPLWFAADPAAVRAVVRPCLFRLGGSFCVVSRNLHRHLRQEVRDHQLQHALPPRAPPLSLCPWAPASPPQPEAGRPSSWWHPR